MCSPSWSGRARDGSRTKRLSRVYFEYPAWSPDGGRIAFMSQTPEGTENYEIYVMNADGSHLRRLTRDPAENAQHELQHGPCHDR